MSNIDTIRDRIAEIEATRDAGAEACESADERQDYWQWWIKSREFGQLEALQARLAALLTPTASADETNALAMSLWAEQIARGMGEPGEQADSTCLDDWLLNRTYPIETLSAAAAGDVAALAEVRAEAGLPVLS